MTRAQKKRDTVLLLPPREDLRRAQKRLPEFKPLDFRALVASAREQNELGVGNAFIAEYRRCSSEQAMSLLGHFGIDPADPKAWEKAFYRLATYERGLGHIAWSPQRTNKNAARWTNDHDLNLIREVTILTAKGVSERKAISQIAHDQGKRKLFPYRPQRAGLERKGTVTKRYEAALWRRLQHLKASASLDSLFGLFGRVERGDLDPFERILRMLDDSHASSQLVKIEEALQTGRS